VKIIGVEQPETAEILRTMFEKRNLIPVIGAGFTKGQPTATGTVPDGGELKQLMLRAISDANPDLDVDRIAGKDLPDVSQYFMDETFVNAEARKALIRRCFTGVKLSRSRLDFLESGWPYAYTLNIDDAIEHNSSFRNKVLPYLQIANVARELGSVFKVHGDALYEISYEESCSLIFSTDSYIQSFSRNASMLNAIRTDLVENNTIFVGCSLDNELDLLFALAGYSGEFPPGRRSIFVTTSEPDRFQLQKLRRYGINTVLIADSYERFYEYVAAVSQVSVVAQTDSLSEFEVPEVRRPLANDRRRNIDFLLRAESMHKEPLVLPDFFIKRTLAAEVSYALESEPIVLIRGRRFSGKSLLLTGIVADYISRHVYFFPSDNFVPSPAITECAALKNALFVFDSNTLTADTALALAQMSHVLIENGSRALVAVNRTEPDVTGIIAKRVADPADFELESRLGRTELDALNRALDRLGIRRFSSNGTILNNTFTLFEEYQYTNTAMLRPRSLSDREIDLLFIVSLTDKISSGLATAFDVRGQDLFQFAINMAPLLELSDTSPGELRELHSRYKIIVNSQFGLSMFMREIVDREGPSGVSDRLYNIAARLSKDPNFKSLAKTMIMFDSVNYLLTEARGDVRATGYRPTVLALYEKLQPLMNESADYWLQRAKSSLYLEVGTDALLQGIEFALKAYKEASRERTVDNAEFTIALLYGKICRETKYAETRYIIEAISWFANAMEKYGGNSNYVRTLVMGRSGRRKNSFHYLCDHLRSAIYDPALLPMRGEVRYLLELDQSYSRTRAN